MKLISKASTKNAFFLFFALDCSAAAELMWAIQYTRPDVGLSFQKRDIICNEFCKAPFFIYMDKNDLFNSIGFLTMERNEQSFDINE